MCFSASASFIASGATGGIGVLSLKKVRSRSDIPFALIPLFFGIQQFTEGILWLSLQGSITPTLAPITTYIYSLFSHVFWPIFIPFAVLLVEKDKGRKKALFILSILGAFVGLYLLYFIVRDPVQSAIAQNSIQYTYHHHFPNLTMGLYLVAICVSCLLSSHSIIRVMGGALLVSFIYSILLYTTTFFSVWCFFGALISVLVYLHFWRTAHADAK